MLYQLLDKDTIRIEILSHLSVAKRGFQTTSCLIEVVNSILSTWKGIMSYIHNKLNKRIEHGYTLI